MVLKSGTRLPISHINSILRPASRSSFRLQLMEVSINIELEHGAWRVARSASRCRLDTLEAELGEIEFIDKCIDDADRIVSIDIVLKARWQKARLLTVGNFNETPHAAPPKQCQIIARSGVFTQPRVGC